MAYFPIMVNLDGKRVLIVGGGETASRKAEQLISFGAEITVVAKELRRELPKSVELFLRGFEREDITEHKDELFLVIAATDDRAVNEEVSELAKSYRIPINVVDDEPLCSFTFPAVVRDKDVVVSVSSGGKSPLVTQYVKKLVKEVLPADIGAINDEMGELRESTRDTVSSQIERKRIYEEHLRELLKDK